MYPYHEIAKRMLKVQDLPQALINRLIDVAVLVEAAGGLLRSRQAIAIIIEQWRRDGSPDVE